MVPFLYGKSEEMKQRIEDKSLPVHLYCFHNGEVLGRILNGDQDKMEKLWLLPDTQQTSWGHHTCYMGCSFPGGQCRFIYLTCTIYTVCVYHGWLVGWSLCKHCHRITFQRLMIVLQNREQIPADVIVGGTVQYVVIMRCYICI